MLIDTPCTFILLQLTELKYDQTKWKTRNEPIQSHIYWISIGYIAYDMMYCSWRLSVINTLRPRQNGRHFADDIFKHIFLNENVCISIKMSLKFVLKGQISNIPALVQIMAWRQPGDKPLSEPMMVSLLTQICVARPQWVNMWITQWRLNNITDLINCYQEFSVLFIYMLVEFSF